MLTILEMKEKRADLVKAGKAVIAKAEKEDRALLDEEAESLDANRAAIVEIDKDIAKEEAAAERRAWYATEADDLKKPDTKKPGTRVEVSEPEILKAKRGGFKSLGHLCSDILAEEVKNPTSPEYRAWKDASTRAAGTGGMIAGIASEGGAMIPEQFVNELFEKPLAESPLLSQLMRIPITAGNTIGIPYINESSRADGSRQGGIRVYRDAELANLTQSKTDIGLLSLKANAMTGYCYVSDDLLRFSAISIDALLTRLFQREFSWKIVDELVNGTGASGMFLGILAAPATVSVAKETGQAATTILWKNIAKMWARRHVGSGPYVWLFNQDCFPQLAEMSIPVGTGGVPVYLPAGGAAGAPYATLMGVPVVECEQSATLGTVGDIALVAPGEFIMATVPGFEAASSIHLKFDYRQTAFRFVMFNAGAPWWSAPLTPYKGTANTQSPFVTLATRS